MQIPTALKPLNLFIGSLLTGAALQVNAAGFAIIEQSASGMGNAYAGAAAVAEDASTIFFNPAGMTNLPGTQMVIAGHIIIPTAEYSDRGSHVNPLFTGGVPVAGSLPGDTSDDGGETGLVPNFYFSTQLSDTLFAGVGANAPFGLATKYDKDWVGRYHALESKIFTLNINPSLAWKLNDQVSLGAGISAQYIRATLSNAVDFGSVCFGLEGVGFIPSGSCAGAGVLPLAADGHAKVKGSDWGFGFNLGALFQVTDSTRIGLSYRSKVKQDLEGDATFRVPANFQAILDMGIPLFSDTGVTAGVDLPESASISLHHEFNDQWTLLADATWTKWNRFDELVIEFDNPSQPDTVQPENWDNSMRYSLGVIYRANNKWTFRAGTAYDETPISRTSDRTPRIPGNDRTWIAVGAGYQVSSTMHVDVGYSHLFVDDTKIDALDHSTGHQLIGTYEADVDILSAQLTAKF